MNLSPEQFRIVSAALTYFKMGLQTGDVKPENLKTSFKVQSVDAEKVRVLADYFRLIGDACPSVEPKNRNWVVEVRIVCGSPQLCVVDVVRDSVVCSVTPLHHQEIRDLSNAILICRAPKMLELLKEVQEKLETSSIDFQRSFHDDLDKLIDQLQPITA